MDHGKRDESQKALIRKMYRILAKSVKMSDVNKTLLTKYLDSIILEHYKDPSADLNSYFPMTFTIFFQTTFIHFPKTLALFKHEFSCSF